jgi:peptide/nickel transport system substrate-binding protein
MLRTNSQGSVRGTVGIALAILTVVAACKSDEPKRAPAGNAKAADGAELQRGGIARLPSNEPKYLNPILEPRFIVANSLIFEGLVGLDAKLDPVERLAQSWEISPDGRTITFKLRDNVKWHDGTKFTSADVAFTFDAIRSTSAATAWKAYMTPVQELTTPDERTVVVTYAEPFAPALVTWTVGILPKHVFSGTGDGGTIDLTSAHANLEPVGTGPFKYSRWELGKRLLLEANRDWWHKRPHLDGIELVFGLGEADVLEALTRGQLDWARVPDVESWLTVAQTGDFRDQFEASEVVESRIRLIAWNTQRAPLDDKRVRKALTFALDRSRVISDVLFGQATSIAGPFFPTMFGHDPSVAPLPFDLDAAKKLLDEAAPAKGDKRFDLEVISVDTFRGPATDGMAAIFRRDLGTLGIDFKLTLLSKEAYYERINRRDYDGVYFGWLPDIPDPDPAALLHSSQAQSGANYAAYSSSEVDKLVDEARRTVDREKRKKLYLQLQQVLSEEMPYTPLYAPYGHYAWTRRLHGVTARDVGPQAPLPGVAAWWLEKK